MNQRTGKILKMVASVVVAAAFLFWAFRSIDFAEFWSGVCQTRWIYIALSVFAAVAALVFRAERWRLQLVMLDPAISRAQIWHGSNIGNVLNLLLPGAGEFVRCGYVRTSKSSYDRTFGTILVERSFDVLAILVLFALSFVLQRDRLSPFVHTNIIQPLSLRFNMSFGTMVLIAVAVVGVLFLAVWALRGRFGICRKLVDSVAGIFAGVGSFFHMRKAPLFLLYTACLWMTYVMMSWCTLKAVPGLETLTLADALFISAVGNLASVVPTPGNLGPYHWLVGMALSDIYLGSAVMNPTGLLFATLGHGSHAILLLVLGLISYICVSIRKNKREN